MPIADIAYLQAHDDPIHLEFPADTTDCASIAEVEALGGKLAQITGLSLQIDHHVQDASFLTDWAAYEELPRAEHGGSGTVWFQFASDSQTLEEWLRSIQRGQRNTSESQFFSD
ncbi:MAG: hypothetical protein R3F31_19635 [Verrucomicrobiales bacterium]